MDRSLKECPFCGGGDVHLDTNEDMWHYVFCNDCRSQTTYFYDDTDATETWNMREREND